jgi:hypothetical protein
MKKGVKAGDGVRLEPSFVGSLDKLSQGPIWSMNWRINGKGGERKFRERHSDATSTGLD